MAGTVKRRGNGGPSPKKEPGSTSPRAARAAEGLAVALFLATAIALTWPLATQLDQGLPLGTETVATVPLASLWSLWWNADRLVVGYEGYWNAPIFHPTASPFAFSEAHVLHGVLGSLLFRGTGSWPVSYNAVVLLALTLNGWAAHRLLLAPSLGRVPSTLGGVLVVALPYVYQELGVLALVPIWGITISLLAALRFVRAPEIKSGARLGLTVGVSYLLCGYYGLMTGLLLALTLPFILLARLRDPKLWVGLLVGGLTAGLLVLPIALPQRAASAEEGFERSEKTVAKHSARAVDHLEAAWPSFVPAPGGTVSKPSSRAFWPGTVRVFLALLGLGWALSHRQHKGRALWLLALGGLGFLFSLGPHATIGPLSIHDLLRTGLPGYGQMRALFRFAVVPQLIATLLAAYGLEACSRGLFRAVRKPARPGLAVLLSTALAFAALADQRPRMGPIHPLPPLELELGWIDWIERNTPTDSVFAFLPFPGGRTSADYLGTAQWMYWQMRHGRPMVNGYSSFFPKSFRDLKKEVASFPSQSALERLASYGVEYVVAHRGFVTGRLDRTSWGGVRLERMFADAATAIDVYRLKHP